MIFDPACDPEKVMGCKVDKEPRQVDMSSIRRSSIEPNRISRSVVSIPLNAWEVPCCGPSSTTEVAYTPPEVLQAAADYHREENERRAFDSWGGEVRETYTLEPKWAMWKGYAILIVLSLIGWGIYDLPIRHAPRDFAGHSIGVVCGYAMCIGGDWIYRKFRRLLKHA